MSSGRVSWVLLAYRLPREPSTPRSALWRKLRRLGAAQVLDGLAALPLDARNREQLEWLADEVVEAGGEATIWVSEPTRSVWVAAQPTAHPAIIPSEAPGSSRQHPAIPADPRSERPAVAANPR